MTETIIIGAGPAGSMTARTILDTDPDHRVMIIDSRDTPGRPYQCAGGLQMPLLRQLNLNIPRHIIKTEITRFIMRSPSGSEFTVTGKKAGMDTLGLIVDREKFDHWLFNRAVDAGAQFRLSQKYIKSTSQGKSSRLLIDVKTDSGTFTRYSCDYLIGADGARSTVAKISFIIPPSNPSDILHHCYQVTVELPHFPQDTAELIFDTRYAPQGYTWAFPEGDDRVRVGVGIPLGKSNPKKYLEKFLMSNKTYDGTVIHRLSGLVSTGHPLDSCIGSGEYSNVAVVGCAGRHTSPLTGGGIVHALIAGRELGKVIGEKRPLHEYDTAWKLKLLGRLQRHYKLKQMIYKYQNKDFDRLVSALQGFEVTTQDVDSELIKLIIHIVKKDPGLIPQFIMKSFFPAIGA